MGSHLITDELPAPDRRERAQFRQISEVQFSSTLACRGALDGRNKHLEISAVRRYNGWRGSVQVIAHRMAEPECGTWADRSRTRWLPGSVRGAFALQRWAMTDAVDPAERAQLMMDHSNRPAVPRAGDRRCPALTSRAGAAAGRPLRRRFPRHGGGPVGGVTQLPNVTIPRTSYLH